MTQATARHILVKSKEACDELKTKIERFRDEELEHRDIAVDYKGREARHYKLLHDVIQTGCRTAIKIAEKI